MHSIAQNRVRWSLVGTVLAAAALFAQAARANPAFPGVLHDQLHMPCVPTCLVCHATLEGGKNNFKQAITPSGQSVPGFGEHLFHLPCGLDGADAASLAPALMCLMDMDPMSNVDQDATPDLTELSVGADPNNADPNAMVCGSGAPPAGPEYGCVRVARQGPVDNAGVAAAAFVALLGLSALRRRRR